MPSTKTILLRTAINSMKNAYCPYSKYQVGACVSSTNGSIYYGNNIENISYGLTVCAERSAIFTMLNFDKGLRIKEILVVTKDGGAPCGACRQVIAEFSTPSTKIYVADPEGIVNELTVEELLPGAFKSELV